MYNDVAEDLRHLLSVGDTHFHDLKGAIEKELQDNEKDLFDRIARGEFKVCGMIRMTGPAEGYEAVADLNKLCRLQARVHALLKKDLACPRAKLIEIWNAHCDYSKEQKQEERLVPFRTPNLKENNQD